MNEMKNTNIPKIRIFPKDINLEEAEASSEELIENLYNPLLRSLCLLKGYSIGGAKEYLTSIIDAKVVEDFEYGESICIFSPTGSGKTRAIEQIALTQSQSEMVIILTNRRACKIQLQKDLIDKTKGSIDWTAIPNDIMDNINIQKNLEIMTYQEFVMHKHVYHGKKILLVCDECHCFAEDSIFSVYPQQMKDYLRNNLENTKRIYITATPDDVIPFIWDVEYSTNNSEREEVEKQELIPLMEDNFDKVIGYNPSKTATRIQHIYLMKTNWDYINFKFYNPVDKDILIKYLNTYLMNDKKALIFINNINEGMALQSLIHDSEHIYSDNDKREQLYEIAVNEKFNSDALITTKVAENGLSLHDEKLSVIVAESYDLTVIQQIIGRIRLNRKKPREITVLIPDYSVTSLGSIKGKIYMQLNEFKNVIKNPGFAMQYNPQPSSNIYYDAFLQKPVLNYVKYHQLQRLIDFISQLKDKENENPHALVRSVLEIYGKSTDDIEELSIDYDNIKECKLRIKSAFEEYKNSNKNSEDLKNLKTKLKEICNETGAYSKELKSNIQIDTINDILLFAGINETILPESKKFEVGVRETS